MNMLGVPKYTVNSELLSDLSVVEKPIPAILMNYDNQTVITKVNSAKDNAKSTRHVKRHLKTVRKLRTGKSLYKRAITECDRNCI
jgi:hypothetical protein